MPKLLLLTSVYGDDAVFGDPGEVRDVPAEVAEVWADGVRTERWTGSKEQQAYREFCNLSPKPGKDD